MTTQDGYDWPTPHEQPPVLAQPMAPYFREQVAGDIAFGEEFMAALAEMREHYAANPPVDMQRRQCWCHTCRPLGPDRLEMVLCPQCGNKRCPKANNHRYACTNSNDPGQPGSAY